VLAAIIALIRYSPRLEVIWAMIVGPPEKREKAKRASENAAEILEKIFGAAEEEKDRAEFAKIGRIPPSQNILSHFSERVRLGIHSEQLG
jgi:hypothetical protein